MNFALCLAQGAIQCLTWHGHALLLSLRLSPCFECTKKKPPKAGEALAAGFYSLYIDLLGVNGAAIPIL